MAGLRANAQNVHDATQPVAVLPARVGGTEMLHPHAKFGDKPGEKRLDSQGNVLPIMDCGGNVGFPVMDSGGDVQVQAPMMYDSGGKVNIHDGLHQLAVLKQGEKVLTPEQAQAYDAGKQAAQQEAPPTQEGAPADFAGPVFPNPDNVQPVEDTKIQPEVDPIDPSAQISTQNAPLETPQGDISNTPGVDVNAKQKPAAPDPHVAQAAANEYGQGEQPPEEPEVKGTEAERKAIEVDKQKAMGQGIPGLVPLGLAKIHENQLSAQPKHLPAMEGEPKVFDNGGDVKGVDVSKFYQTGSPVGMVSPSRYSYVPTMTPEAPRPSVDFQGGRYPVVNNVDTGRSPAEYSNLPGKGIELPSRFKFQPAPTMAEDSSKLSTQELGQGMAHADYLPPIPARPVPQALRTYDEGGDVALTPEQLATVKAHELQTQANMVVPGKAASDQSVTQPIARVGMPQMTAAAPAEVKQPSRMPVPAAEPAPQVKPTSPGMPQMTAQAAPTMATPTYGGPGKAVPQGQMIPEKQLPQDEFKAKMAAYDTQIQAALDTATPEGKEQADRLALAKQNFQHKNPWGSEGNHPGFMGKLGHGLAMAGNIGLDVLAPKTAELIPGTQLNRMQQQAATERGIGEDVAAGAKADKAAVLPNLKEATQGGMIDPKHPELGPQQALFNEKTGEVTYKGPMPPKVGSEDDQDKWVGQALTDRKLPDTADNRKALISEYAGAHQAPTLVEHKNPDGSITYEAAKAGQTIAGPEGKVGSTAAEENKFKGKTLYFDTPQGRQAYTAEEAKAAGLDPTQGTVINEGQAGKDREKNSTFSIISHSLDQYQTDMAKTTLSPKEFDALSSMTNKADSPDYLSKIIAGVFDDVMGHPVTGYSEKLMKGTLDANQYQDMSPGARKLVADYYTTMMAHFANLKATQGTIPRNPAIIEAEMQTIPRPYLTAEQASEKFQNYKDSVGMRNVDNVKFTNGKKEERSPEEAAAPKEATHIAPGPDGKMHYTNEAGTQDYGLAPSK
jgi:hypothetical protein